MLRLITNPAMPESAPPPKKRLQPARPAQVDEGAGYMPRIPWRLLLIGTLTVTTVAAGYWMSETKKADALRAQIVRMHEEQLEEPARRYVAFRERLEGLIVAAAERAPERYADPRLRLPGLRSGKGLYLRLPAKDAHTPKKIAAAAKAMEADLIPSCLGLAPASGRGVWEKGEFLTPAWLAEKRKDEGVMKLRVTATMLANHVDDDLPALLNTLRSDWFLLALEHGKSRREGPVDVFLWDLRSGDPLLRGRVQAAGILFSAHIASAGSTVRTALPPDPRGAAADDCSIASKIKEIGGLEAVTVENAQGAAAAPQAPTAPSGAADPETTPTVDPPQPSE